jgi:hypothetical protein
MLAGAGLLAFVVSLFSVSYRQTWTRTGQAGWTDHTVLLAGGRVWATNGGSYLDPGLSVGALARTKRLDQIRWWPDEAWVQTFRMGPGPVYWVVEMPLWAPVVLGLVVWCCGIPDLLRRRRAKAGLCPGCGYDLGGIGAGCPECGRGRAAKREGSG